MSFFKQPFCYVDSFDFLLLIHLCIPNLNLKKKEPKFVYHKTKNLCINSGNAPPNNDNISVSNPFEDPVAPRPPYQQHAGAQFPPVSRPQGILQCLIFYVCFIR